ncbi:MAG: tRNA 2-thiocytidine(32) synthetase TtcA [Firmicutes bacterium]|nr:tRNA 2-thiocytidine(32) synthetase TtcA [Candidatus Colimorpha enterica]
MEFNSIRHVLSCTRRAVDKYGMIEEGDKIAVGLSGGKDSIALLAALINLRMFYPKHFTLCGITVSMGFEGADYSPIGDFCAENGIEYRIVDTQLAKLIFEDRKESNPCSLCARMRRGILHDTAKEMGCNKLALGHHYDDVIDTFMLNLFNEGRLSAFLPVTYLSRKNITLIRPFLYLPEKDIRYFMSKNSLPVLPSLCPEDKHTERETVHQLVADLDRNNKGLKHRIFTAMENGGIFEQYEEEES